MAKIFYQILDKKRIEILDSFLFFKKDFYLAGGTGLALQIGHRDSIDFDFFTRNDFDTIFLFNKLKEIFIGRKIEKTQEEKNTLSVIIDDEVKISFLRYDYRIIGDFIDTDYFRIASIEDIGCMKCSAIVSRSLLKDYVDLYYIIKEIGLSNLLDICKKKFKDVDISLILKSLIYFDDIVKEKIDFKNSNKINLKEVQYFFKKEIEKLDLNK
jgi:hypothetical protein